MHVTVKFPPAPYCESRLRLHSETGAKKLNAQHHAQVPAQRAPPYLIADFRTGLGGKASI